MQYPEPRPPFAVANCFNKKKAALLRARWLVCLTLPLFVVPLAQSQTAAPNSTKLSPTLKSSARLVVEDVIVTDRNGRPAPGLQKEAFLVEEDGHRQKITSFEEHTGT